MRATADIHAETELLWLLARSGARRREADSRIRALAEGASSGRLAALMDRHRSRLVLGRRAQALGIVGSDFTVGWQELYDWGTRRVLLFDGLTQRMTRALESEGISALALKGPALSEQAHGDAALRVSGDIDLLVAPEQFDAAVAGLSTLGYRLDERDRSPFHRTLIAEGAALPPIELHWRLHWYGDRFARNVLREAVTQPDGSLRSRPETLMAILLLCYARDGFVGLRLPIDIAGLVDRHGDQIDWDAVRGYGTNDPEIEPSLRTAIAVADRVVGLPAAAVEPLRQRRERLAARLCNWDKQGDYDQVAATVRLTDLLMAPPRHAARFLPARFRPFPSPVHNLLYLARTLVRWAPALASIGRGRRPHPLP